MERKQIRGDTIPVWVRKEKNPGMRKIQERGITSGLKSIGATR